MKKKVIKKTRTKIEFCKKLITLNEKFPNTERLGQIKQRIFLIEKQLKEQAGEENSNKEKNIKKLLNMY